MKSIISAAVDHSRSVLSLLVLLLLAGAGAYVTIPKESNPDINIPIIYVSLSLSGVSPEDSERLMVRPMEQELRSIEGVKEMSANSYLGGGNVILEFEAGFDADQAVTDVREAVDRAEPDLPDTADDPTVNEVNFSLFPVLVATLSGSLPERTLVRVARDLRDTIEAIPEVLEVRIGGDREEVVEVIVDPLIVESYGLSGQDVLSAVGRSNRLIAAGNLDTGAGRFSVSVPGLFEDLGDILTLPLSVNGDAVVQFQDVATIRRTFKDPENFARVDGQPAVSLEIVKRNGENVIGTIGRVMAVIEQEREFWPHNLVLSITQDESQNIRNMLTDLQNNVLSAIVLVMIMVVGALGFRSGLLVGIAIPASFLTGILVLSTAGLTVNIVVLFSLILAVGMLVDGAIVVTEYADRKMTEGVGRRLAYKAAAQRMSWPIIASTATTLAAFLPLAFWPGVVGEFMKFLPITLMATLAASLVVALVFVPTIGAIFGKPGSLHPATVRAMQAAESGNVLEIGGFTGGYVRALNFMLKAPWLVLMMAAAALVGAWVTFAVAGKGVEFFPSVEPDTSVVLVHARGNMSIEEQDALVREVEARILAIPGDEFKSVYARTGASGAGGDTAEDVIGQITLNFRDWDERRPATEIQEDILEWTADLAGIVVEIREAEAGPPVGKPVQVELRSRNPEVLTPAVAELRAFMDSLDGLVDVEDSRPTPGIEWELDVDRSQAAKYGLDVATVGDSIKLATNGLTIGDQRPDDADDQIDIILRYPDEYRSLTQLDAIRVVSPSAGTVPISNFVTRSPQPRTGTLTRIDGLRSMTVQAGVEDGILPDAMVRQIEAFIAEAGFDDRIVISFGGEDEEQQAAQAFLMQAFMIALGIMALILITQFNSFSSAVMILSAVVMSTVGVMIGLLLTDQPFGIVMTGIGVVSLAGIVVNNNIVLIDTFDHISRESRNVREAILRTGAQRLRPVLLTTVTTILGLMPMVLRVNIDFVTREISVGAPSTQWWVSLATAIVFGLGFATLLTLVVTPSALMFRHQIGGLYRRIFRRSETGIEMEARYSEA